MPEDYRYSKRVTSERQRGLVASKRQSIKYGEPTYDEAVANLKAAEVELAERTRGLESNAKLIAKKQGIPVDRARAILAAKARSASPAAKRRNPRLKRVKG